MFAKYRATERCAVPFGWQMNFSEQASQRFEYFAGGVTPLSIRR
jgi:hypothetical protein